MPGPTEVTGADRLWWQTPAAKALLAGALLALSYPPLPLGFVAYFAVVPLLQALRQTGGREGFRLGYLTGLVYCAGVMYWIGMNTGTYRWAAVVSAIMAVAFIAVNTGLFGLAMGLVHRKHLPGGWWWAAPLWTGVEFLRSFGILVFPWGNLSLTQAHYLPIIQMASITGMYGVSFWILLVNTAVFYYLESRATGGVPVKRMGLLLLIYLVPLGYGVAVLETLPGRTAASHPVRVGVVQPNTDPNRKGDEAFRRQNFLRMDSLSTISAAHQADLIVWPEASAPAYVRLNRYGYRTRLQRWVDSTRIPILTGVVDWEAGPTGKTPRENGYFYNAAMLFEPGRDALQTYRKVKLVPFAEYVPYQRIFGFFYAMDLGQGWYTPGREYTVFDSRAAGGTQFSAAICYDSSFPGLVWRFRQQGADWLAVITNDAWFGDSSGPFQHAQWARIRAVENRMPVIRAANTGISMIIDPWGRIRGRLPLDATGTLTGTVETGLAPSWYARHGDLFGGAGALMAVLAVVGALIGPARFRK